VILPATDGKAYRPVCPSARRRNRPAIRAFRRFLMAKVAADAADDEASA